MKASGLDVFETLIHWVLILIQGSDQARLILVKGEIGVLVEICKVIRRSWPVIDFISVGSAINGLGKRIGVVSSVKVVDVKLVQSDVLYFGWRLIDQGYLRQSS